MGGGLAGITTALVCAIDHHKKVVLIDDSSQSCSSRIAAGIYNPIVFKRTTLAWRAKEMIDIAKNWYLYIENLLGHKFHDELPLLRVISGYEEQNEWLRKSTAEKFSPFLSSAIQNNSEKSLNIPFGFGQVSNAGRIHVEKYLQSGITILTENNYLKEKFNYNSLVQEENKFLYGDFEFDKIVFCEGWKVMNNPFFNTVKLYPVKGDVITFTAKNLNENTIYNCGAYIVPEGNGIFKAGSTYDWKNLNDIPDHTAKEELLQKIGSFYRGEINLINHLAGVRPAANDRKPILGEHPKHKGVYILNGLGTKGVSLAPYCALRLGNFIFKNQEIEREIDVKRFIT